MARSLQLHGQFAHARRCQIIGPGFAADENRDEGFAHRLERVRKAFGRVGQRLAGQFVQRSPGGENIRAPQAVMFRRYHHVETGWRHAWILDVHGEGSPAAGFLDRDGRSHRAPSAGDEQVGPGRMDAIVRIKAGKHAQARRPMPRQPAPGCVWIDGLEFEAQADRLAQAGDLADHAGLAGGHEPARLGLELGVQGD